MSLLYGRRMPIQVSSIRKPKCPDNFKTIGHCIIALIKFVDAFCVYPVCYSSCDLLKCLTKNFKNTKGMTRFVNFRPENLKSINVFHVCNSYSILYMHYKFHSQICLILINLNYYDIKHISSLQVRDLIKNNINTTILTENNLNK